MNCGSIDDRPRRMTTLRIITPEMDEAIMDNASFHHTQVVVDTVMSRGHNIHYLPPYSPFFNPIENFFHQWKVYVRSQRCSDEQALRDALAGCVQIATPDICRNYIRHVMDQCDMCLLGERNLH
jgi:transposase